MVERDRAKKLDFVYSNDKSKCARIFLKTLTHIYEY
jgi:hypothetical protein